MSKIWTPPKKLLPISPEAYAALAVTIENGAKMAEHYERKLKEGCAEEFDLEDDGVDKDPVTCLPPSSPGVSEMAEFLYRYIPASSIPLAPGLDDLDRPTIETFRVGRKQLLAALDAATPPGVRAKIGDTSGADDPGPEGGPSWWAWALAAGGVLAWLGRRNFYGLVAAKAAPKLASLAASLLFGLAAVEVIEEVGENAKDIIVPPLKQGFSALVWIAGGAVVVAGVVLVAKLAARPQPALKPSEKQ